MDPIKNIAPVATSSNLGDQQPKAPQEPLAAPLAQAQKPVASAQGNLRLVIERHAGSYIYKTINLVTGEVVAQYPRESVIKMRDVSSYKAGAVVKTSV